MDDDAELARVVIEVIENASGLDPRSVLKSTVRSHNGDRNLAFQRLLHGRQVYGLRQLEHGIAG